MKKNQKCEMDYAVEYAEFLIKEKHKYTLAEMIVFYWLHKPNYRRLTMLNLATLDYHSGWERTHKAVRKILQEDQKKTKEGKNEKGNVVKLDTSKLN